MKTGDGKNAIIGMSRETGKRIDREAHISQSIVDILTTPIGSRIQRREYGSHLFDLIDSAGNDAGRLRLLAALVDAVNRWEPRVLLDQASIDITQQGQVILNHRYVDRQKNAQTPLNGNVIL